MSTGTVEGRVIDLSNNGPIPGAEVEIKGDEKSEEKQVDEEGYFRFADLPTGEYVLEVAAEGFKSGPPRRAGCSSPRILTHTRCRR